MIKTFALLASIVMAATAPSQGTESGAKTPDKELAKPQTPPVVSVSSKGSDVRVVLHDMFKQVGKSFVLGPDIRYYLYLSLEKIEFEEALALVCKMAFLKVDVQNGIYFIEKQRAPAQSEKAAEKPPAQTEKPVVKGSFEAKPATKGKLNETVLAKKVTTRFEKIDLRLLLSNLTQQTGVPFEVSSDVPAFKLDAYLISTSLKFALDTICSATKLQYKFTDQMSIQISKPAPANRVAIVGG
jgi:hypothetical protein